MATSQPITRRKSFNQVQLQSQRSRTLSRSNTRGSQANTRDLILEGSRSNKGSLSRSNTRGSGSGGNGSITGRLSRSDTRGSQSLLSLTLSEAGDELGTDKGGTEGDEICRRHGVLAPESTVRGYLDAIIILITFYFVVLLPVQLAFTAEETIVLFYVNVALDGIYCLELILNFFTAFRPSYEELVARGTAEEVLAFLVFERRKIALAYVRGAFLPDLILSLPCTDLLFGGMRCCNREQAAKLRWPRFVRLICRVVRGWRTLRFGRAQAIVAKHFQGIYGLSAMSVHLSQFAVGLLLLVHWTACIFYAVASCDWQERDCYFSEVPVLTVEECGKDGGSCVARCWLTAVLMVLLLVNGESYPLRSHTSLGEQLLVIGVIISGTVILGLVFGQVAIALSEANQQKRADAAAMSRLESSLRALHLDPTLQRQVLEYCEIQADLYRPETVVRELAFPSLNGSLKGLVELYLKSTVISEIPLVADLVRDSKPAATSVCARLQLRTYLAGDILGHKHVRADHLAVLLVGVCARVKDSGDVQNSEGPVVLFANALFLDIGVYREKISARAHCEVYEMTAAAFEEVKEEFPYSCVHAKALKNFTDGLEEFASNDTDVLPPEDIDTSSEESSSSDSESGDEPQPVSFGRRNSRGGVEEDMSSAQASSEYFYAAQRKLNNPKYNLLRRMNAQKCSVDGTEGRGSESKIPSGGLPAPTTAGFRGMFAEAGRGISKLVRGSSGTAPQPTSTYGQNAERPAEVEEPISQQAKEELAANLRQFALAQQTSPVGSDSSQQAASNSNPDSAKNVPNNKMMSFGKSLTFDDDALQKAVAKDALCDELKSPTRKAAEGDGGVMQAVLARRIEEQRKKQLLQAQEASKSGASTACASPHKNSHANSKVQTRTGSKNGADDKPAEENKLKSDQAHEVPKSVTSPKSSKSPTSDKSSLPRHSPPVNVDRMEDSGMRKTSVDFSALGGEPMLGRKASLRSSGVLRGSTLSRRGSLGAQKVSEMTQDELLKRAARAQDDLQNAAKHLQELAEDKKEQIAAAAAQRALEAIGMAPMDNSIDEMSDHRKGSHNSIGSNSRAARAKLNQMDRLLQEAEQPLEAIGMDNSIDEISDHRKGSHNSVGSNSGAAQAKLNQIDRLLQEAEQHTDN